VAPAQTNPKLIATVGTNDAHVITLTRENGTPVTDIPADTYTIEVRDRSKDIIISGGENISSIEVEGALYRHPAVLEAAVVARPDAKWGETPCAFVTLKPGAQVTAEELIAHCRGEIAHYKVPRTIVFAELPKTSTGKVQKNLLRERARGL
jgi:fatty-acyl-CoA synthase